MNTEYEEGSAEICYRLGCQDYVTGSSDYCSPECEKADNPLMGATVISQRTFNPRHPRD